jgi:hypothetical protein
MVKAVMDRAVMDRAFMLRSARHERVSKHEGGPRNLPLSLNPSVAARS